VHAFAHLCACSACGSDGLHRSLVAGSPRGSDFKLLLALAAVPQPAVARADNR
jgi:hypothetical protein